MRDAGIGGCAAHARRNRAMFAGPAVASTVGCSLSHLDAQEIEMPKAKPATKAPKAPKAPETKPPSMTALVLMVQRTPSRAGQIIAEQGITDPGIVVQLMQAAMEAQLEQERERRDAPQPLEIEALAKKGKLQVRFRFPKYEGGSFQGGVWMNAENAQSFKSEMLAALDRAMAIAADLPQDKAGRDRHKRQNPSEYQDAPQRPNFS